MTRCLILCLFCLYALESMCQDSVRPRQGTVVAAMLGMPGIGLSAEWNYGSSFTVETASFFGVSYNVEEVWLLPFINVQPSYSKPAMRFSVTGRGYLKVMNRIPYIDPYFGLTYAYVTRSFDKENNAAHLVNLHVGVRQFASRRIIFNAYAGVGWAMNAGTNFKTAYPAINVMVGYRLWN